MYRFIGRRFFFAVLTILAVSAVVFAIFSVLPFEKNRYKTKLQPKNGNYKTSKEMQKKENWEERTN